MDHISNHMYFFLCVHVCPNLCKNYALYNGHCCNRRDDNQIFDVVIIIVKLYYRYQVLYRLLRTDNVIYFIHTYFLSGFRRLQLEPKHWNTVIMFMPLFTLIIYAAADVKELRNEQWFHSNISWDLLSKPSKCWFSKRVPNRKWETMINHTCQAP